MDGIACINCTSSLVMIVLRIGNRRKNRNRLSAKQRGGSVRDGVGGKRKSKGCKKKRVHKPQRQLRDIIFDREFQVFFNHLLSFMFRVLSFPTRSTRSRNDFDDGLYSEHIMLRNLFVCWLLVVEEQRGKYGNQSKTTPDSIFESCR